MLKVLKSLGLVILLVVSVGANAKVETNYEKGLIEFEGAFDEISVHNTIEEMEEAIELGSKLIVIKWNSPGGSILAGFKLINAIRKHQAKGIKFRGVVDRICASMCFMTLQHMDERVSYEYGLLLDHEPRGGNSGAQLLEIAELLKALVVKKLKARGVSELAIKLYKLRVADTFLMNTKTALMLGLLDRVILPGEEVKPMEKSNAKVIK